MVHIEETMKENSEVDLEVVMSPSEVEAEEHHPIEAASEEIEVGLEGKEAVSEGIEAHSEGKEALTEGIEAHSEVEELMMAKKRSRPRFTSRDLVEVIQNEN